MSAGTVVPVSVVVPARNAEEWIESCLKAIGLNRPAEVILVDGGSTDRTVERARPFVDRIIDDGGAGVAAARMLGVQAATQPWVALIDADVVLPPNGLQSLLDECAQRQLLGLQAGLRSTGTGDYWSGALADHHNQGRSKGWFGICASLVRRDVMLEHPLDADFASGEDIDLRVRLRRLAVPVGVSRSTIVSHRFGSGLRFARDQWLADGAGLGRLVRKHGLHGVVPALIPFAAALLGLTRGVRQGLRPWPYFGGLALGNYVGLWHGLADRRVSLSGGDRILAVLVTAATLIALSAVAAAGAAILGVGLMAFRPERSGEAASAPNRTALPSRPSDAQPAG